ncbi:MAG: deoxyribodipyrimidine photolyase [Legionellales bacterium]|nr:deoxyribodipyrimidine photolyase [Legionellales bacterium]
MTVICWFRNDLRLRDNSALIAAAKASDDVIPLYILDDKQYRPLGGAQRWWLHHSLTSLAADLDKYGLQLLLRNGNSKKILAELADTHNITGLYWNQVFEPKKLAADNAIRKFFESNNIEVDVFNDNLLNHPDDIKNKSGQYFKVFTPYWRTASEFVVDEPPRQKPRTLAQRTKRRGDKLNDWDLLPTRPDWSGGFDCWQPGEAGAHKALGQFVDAHVHEYLDKRDRPDLPGTSQLSPYIHFGELSPRQIWHSVKQAEQSRSGMAKGAAGFLRQLGWREFSYHLLYHFPEFPTDNFRAEFDKFSWDNDKQQLKTWQQGQTGYPIVDAGMRQLWHTGYMHNRVRMIVASFLTKDLFIDWRKGEAWFWDTLVDADLANNVAGWQWVAGSGADASPYFRIFNPTTQGEKFDPDGDYVRQWVPELADLPNKFIHNPSAAPKAILDEANVILGETYPWPMVDHKEARETALARYKDVK